jgi:hypothetical protein
MQIPPISQPSATFPLGETPQQQLESLLDQIAKLAQQLNQHAANPKELDKLMAQFQKISNEMQPFINQLPSAQKEQFSSDFQHLKNDMSTLFNAVNNQDSLQINHTASIIQMQLTQLNDVLA